MLKNFLNEHDPREICMYVIVILISAIMIVFIFINCYADLQNVQQNMVHVNAEVIEVRTQTVEKTYLIGAKVLVPVKKTVTNYNLTLKYTYNGEQYTATVDTDDKYETGNNVHITTNRTGTIIYSIERQG